MPAYLDMAAKSWGDSALRCTRAGLGDLGITLGVYALGGFAAGKVLWAVPLRLPSLLFLGLSAGVYAVLVEQAAIASGRWAYTAHMPRIPAVDVGVWPVLQVSVLVPLTVAMAVFATRTIPETPQGEGCRSSDSA